MTIRLDLKKGLIMLAIYIFLTMFLFMAADRFERLDNLYKEENTYVNIDKYNRKIIIVCVILNSR